MALSPVSPSFSSISPEPLSSAAIDALRRKRGSLGSGLTNLGRAIDKKPFVHGLRRWVVPSVLLSSVAWVVGASIHAPTEEERNKRLIKYGMGALGTVAAALAGFKFILKPDPNTAGTLGHLAVEHLSQLLPKAQRARLPHTGEALLEKTLKELGLAEKFPKWADNDLGHVLEEELTGADDVLGILDHLNLPLGKFRERLEFWAKQAEATGGNGLNPKDVQQFRSEMLTHVFEEHGVPLSNDARQTMARMKSRFLNIGAIKKLRIHLEESLSKFTDFKDDIAERATELMGEGKNAAKASYKAHSEQATKLLNAVVDGPGGISSAEMREEIWELSLMGLLPVVGGVAGGALGDAMAGDNWKETIKAKGKEGLFQYLANIMLCNVGAMGFIGAMEKINEKNLFGLGGWAGKYWPRVGAMTAGILAVGVIGGSFIANFLGENILNPLIDKGPGGMVKHLRSRVEQDGVKGLFKDLYANRVPEPLDVMLHIDDFATGAAISGLSFVEPFLALFYTLSGIRAGMGYRNRNTEANANLTDTPAIANTPVLGSYPLANTVREASLTGIEALPSADVWLNNAGSTGMVPATVPSGNTPFGNPGFLSGGAPEPSRRPNSELPSFQQQINRFNNWQ